MVPILTYILTDNFLLLLLYLGRVTDQRSITSISRIYWFMVYGRGRQPMARVPSVARETIFNGTLSELKYNNYDLIKNEFLIK